MSEKNEKQRLLEELEGLSPELFNMKKEGREKGGLRTPEGYFDTLAERVLSQAEQEGAAHKETTTLFTVFRNQRFMIAAAAAIVVLLVAVLWLSPNDNSIQNPSADAIELDPAETEAYIIEHIDEYEPELLAQHAELGDIDLITTEPSPNTTASGNTKTEKQATEHQSEPQQQPTKTKKPEDFNFNDLSDEELDALFKELAEEEILNIL
jgi:type IV secretory pathway VirB10-like protein